MASVEQELYNIFTFYTLHGNPQYPDLLKASSFVKLAKDCQMIRRNVTAADIQVVYTAEVKRKDRQMSEVQKMMSYNDFLNALMRLSTRVYPASPSVDDAFQQLLMENVLPLASRRSPDPVAIHLEKEDVRDILDYFGDAIHSIFQFYATAADHKRRTDTSDKKKTMKVNTMKEALGYNEFLKFAVDFNLSSSQILSSLELGDIYLSSIKLSEGDGNIRKLTFLEFWEAVVRCALVAYSKISEATIADKIMGLFLYMWRSVNKTVPRAIAERRNIST